MRATWDRLKAGGWRWVLGICAFPALLTFLLRLFVPESEKWQETVRERPRARLTEIFTPALYRHTLIGAALSCVALIGTWGSVQWIPPWVNKLTGSQETTNYVQMCSGLGVVLGCLGGALLGQYAGQRASYFALGLGSL